MKTDVGAEVGELRSCIEAARTLVDLLRNHCAPDAETAKALPARISAVLNIASVRLGLLERCLNGSRNPAELAASYSSAVGSDGTHIAEWSPARRRADVERELRQLQADRPRSRRRRSS
ncbi:MAG: hypothetical protein INH41_20755 [Myxococcaceae bacterium]|jgi:hypothetical protein|nr:hypothetical protein [Myxococcaceae bacterium]